MGYIILVFFIIILIGIIVFLGYKLHLKDYQYQYKADKMSSMEQEYQNQIHTLEGTIANLNHTIHTHALTKIGNLDYFIERCPSLFEKYSASQFVMIGFSISNMGTINQLYGPSEGDKALIYAAEVLKNNISGNYTYAHVNSNLFGILLKDPSEDNILDIIQKITDELKNYSPTTALTAVFGIYHIDRNRREDSLMDIMNHTLLAQKAVKDPKISNYAFYTEELNKKYNENKRMSMEMEEALEKHKFIPYLQPMIDLHSYQIVAAEALIRWDYPGQGLLSPYAFLPLFENNSLIRNLDYYMWEECCKIIRRWIDNKITPLPLAMNISPIHLQTTAFIDKLEELVKTYLIPKEMLILELPERGVTNASKDIEEIIKQLRNQNFCLCIDNFGSVHSPLNILKDYPIDRIKLDRSFLTRNSSSTEGLTIMRYLIAMAKELNLTVITEGVESLEQSTALADMGCDIAQGYFFAKPLPVRDFDQLKKSMLHTLYRPSEYYPTFADFSKDIDILTQMIQRVS